MAWDQTPSWEDTPRQTPPAQCMLGYTPPCPVHAGIHTPLPSACWDTYMCNPPAATAADVTHPTGMHSCLGSYCTQGSREVRATTLLDVTK